MQKEDKIDQTIFYERQLAVFGQTALDKIRNLKVIIVNLNSVVLCYIRSGLRLPNL